LVVEDACVFLVLRRDEVLGEVSWFHGFGSPYDGVGGRSHLSREEARLRGVGTA